LTDKAVATLDPGDLRATTEHERAMLERMTQTRAALGDVMLERVRRLPLQTRVALEDGGEIVVVHGSPLDPSEPLTHDMSDDEINALLGDDPADVVVCGMSHVPFDRVVSDVRVINVGSVGEAPDGGPRGGRSTIAHATWIESTTTGLLVEQVVIPLGVAPARSA
jgi:diadenosine tetraphosphatase ApaH/serine/threonine PP2A family protein phosphatase